MFENKLFLLKYGFLQRNVNCEFQVIWEMFLLDWFGNVFDPQKKWTLFSIRKSPWNEEFHILLNKEMGDLDLRKWAFIFPADNLWWYRVCKFKAAGLPDLSDICIPGLLLKAFPNYRVSQSCRKCILLDWMSSMVLQTCVNTRWCVAIRCVYSVILYHARDPWGAGLVYTGN